MNSRSLTEEQLKKFCGEEGSERGERAGPTTSKRSLRSLRTATSEGPRGLVPSRGSEGGSDLVATRSMKSAGEKEHAHGWRAHRDSRSIPKRAMSSTPTSDIGRPQYRNVTRSLSARVVEPDDCFDPFADDHVTRSSFVKASAVRAMKTSPQMFKEKVSRMSLNEPTLPMPPKPYDFYQMKRFTHFKTPAAMKAKEAFSRLKSCIANRGGVLDLSADMTSYKLRGHFCDKYTHVRIVFNAAMWSVDGSFTVEFMRESGRGLEYMDFYKAVKEGFLRDDGDCTKMDTQNDDVNEEDDDSSSTTKVDHNEVRMWTEMLKNEPMYGKCEVVREIARLSLSPCWARSMWRVDLLKTLLDSIKCDDQDVKRCIFAVCANMCRDSCVSVGDDEAVNFMIDLLCDQCGRSKSNDELAEIESRSHLAIALSRLLRHANERKTKTIEVAATKNQAAIDALRGL